MHRAHRRRRSRWASALAVAALLAGAAGGCGSEPACSFTACECLGEAGGCGASCTADPPAVSAPVMVVPSAGLPRGLELRPANNNLDVALHDDRVFLAFRTAPTHFADADVTLHVVSSCDEVTWRREGSFSLGTDLREPRLLSWQGHLFLYFAVLGQNPAAFEPQGMMVAEYRRPGSWTEPAWFYGEGFIPWRVRILDGVPYLLTYVGGGAIYGAGGTLEVHFLTTADGRTWEPVVPGQPVVLSGGVSETDFAFAPDGALVAVSRDEEGDESGWGSRICHAEPGSLGTWNCVTDPKKYDSPLVFRHRDEIYLIGRRHLSETGNYDLFRRDLDHEAQTRAYQLDYWKYPKRCSLWRIDPQTLAVTFVLDLPSRGDTCFPALLPLSADRYRVYNYSSPLDGEDVDWLTGQSGPTNILAVTLALP